MRKLTLSDSGFDAALHAALSSRQHAVAGVASVVESIIADVRTRGDTALLDYTAKFDHVTHESAQSLKLSGDVLRAAHARISEDLRRALTLAETRIRAYHTAQMPRAHEFCDDAGMQLGWRYHAIDAVGLYVPGGKASYPSSVLMNAVPAKVAGVKRTAMVVPAPHGVLSDSVLAAAFIAGIDEVYTIGGAQAVAALAYGTASIEAVDKIVGPGNAYVAEAKRQVFGTVGIDTIAGPSEVLIVADGKNDPRWIAADLLAQAEHDEQAQSILITEDDAFADRVIAAVEAMLPDLASGRIARASWDAHALVVVVKHLRDAYPMIAKIAPEHLQLAVEDAAAFAAPITRAGAIFLGRYCPEALGDYLAGPSHVLPTSSAARFASGLSVFDFLTRTSVMGAAHAPDALLRDAAIMADAESLPAHALSLRLRLSS